MIKIFSKIENKLASDENIEMFKNWVNGGSKFLAFIITIFLICIFGSVFLRPMSNAWANFIAFIF